MPHEPIHWNCPSRPEASLSCVSYLACHAGTSTIAFCRPSSRRLTQSVDCQSGGCAQFDFTEMLPNHLGEYQRDVVTCKY